MIEAVGSIPKSAALNSQLESKQLLFATQSPAPVPVVFYLVGSRKKPAHSPYIDRPTLFPFETNE